MADIPVNASDAVTIVAVTSNGQINFDYDFRADLIADLKAEYRPASGAAVTILVGGVDFTASGLGTAGGGTITLTAFVTVNGDSMAIYRDITVERGTDYTRDLFADDINAEQDRVFMIMQEVIRDQARSILLPLGYTGNNGLSPEDGTVIGWDGNDLVNLDPAEFISAAGLATAAQGAKADTALQPGDPASEISFLGPLADEVSKTVYLNLIETLRVSRWDVDPSQTAANNTANMLKAIAAKTKAEFVFQGGDYHFNGKLLVPNGSAIYFVGDGPSATRLVQDDLTKDLIDFDINDAQRGGGVRGLSIAANVPFGDRGASGIGLRVRRANDNFVCRDFEIVGFDKGLRVDASYYPQFSNFRILYFADYGALLSPFTGAGTDGAGANFAHGKISNFGFTGDRSASIGLDIQQASGEFFDTIDITVTNIGVKVAPPVGSYARYLFMTKVLADSCDTYGWLFDGSNAPVVANETAMCWASNTQGDAGVRIAGANLDDLRWVGGWVRDGREEGVRLAGGTNVSFLGASITRNSAAADNTYSGFCVSAGVSDWSVSLCRIGNVSTTVNTSTQLHNILVEPGASQNFRIISNDLRDPGAGGLPVNNNSTVDNWIVDKNLPVSTPGTNRDTSADFAGVSVGTVAAASTVYLGQTGQQASQLDAHLMLGRGGVVTQLVVQVTNAPGAGESFTYTVQKNDVDTAMTGAISGADFQFVSSTPFTVSPADRLTLKLVTSSGAVASRHRWVINVDA